MRHYGFGYAPQNARVFGRFESNPTRQRRAVIASGLRMERVGYADKGGDPAANLGAFKGCNSFSNK